MKKTNKFFGFCSRTWVEIVFFVFFVLVHVPDLGHDNFNTDVWRWKARTYDFGSGVFTLDFEKTLQKYHPGVTIMWIGTAGVKLYKLYYLSFMHTTPPDNSLSTVFELDFTQKFLLVLAISSVLTLTLYLLKKMFGTTYALLSGFLITTEPFYLGLTRVFHLEGLMSALMIGSIVALYYSQTSFTNVNVGSVKNGVLSVTSSKAPIKWMLLSGILAGFALLTKTSAFYLLPFTILGLFILSFDTSTSNLKDFVKTLHLRIFSILRKWLVWLLSLVVTFIAFWPAMWVAPGKVLSELYEGIFVVGVELDHQQFYFGSLVDSPGFEYYLVVLVLRSSITLLLSLSVLLFLTKKLDLKKQRFLTFLFIYVLFYLIQISIPSKKLDRYILPAIVALVYVAGFTLDHLRVFLSEKICVLLKRVLKSSKLIGSSSFVLVLFLLLFVNTYTVFYLHPDYLSYYNPLLGGLKNGITIIEPKWMIGAREVANYFEKNRLEQNYPVAPNDDPIEELIIRKEIQKYQTVAFPEKYYTQVWPFVRETGTFPILVDLKPLAKHAKYFVYPTWNDQHLKDPSVKLEYHGTIYLRSVPIYTVYKRV